MIKTVIAVYPGRFQPFGAHHAEAFNWLEKQFGKGKTFIVTSNVVNPPKSPFNFAEKKAIISSYKIADRLIMVKNPYKAEELMKRYDAATTAVVFMVGKKDMTEDPRFAMKPKKDGTSSYFQPYDSNKGSLEGYDKHGYLIVAPHISINIPGYGEMSGTQSRKALSDNSKSRDEKGIVFKGIFGWEPKSNPELADTIFDKLEDLNEGSVFSKKWWADSLSLNEESNLPPRQWKDFKLNTMSDSEMKVVWDMYTGTYLKQGMNLSADDFKELRTKYKGVYLEDIDGDTVADAFIVHKSTNFGNKIALLGTNDKSDAKKDLIEKLFKLLNTNGWFIEAGMKIEEILKKSNIPAVTDVKVIEGIVGDKGLEIMEDGYYKRKLSKVDKSIIKRMYGIPKTSSVKEGVNTNKSVVITEGGAGGHMHHPFDIEWVKTGKDLVKAFQMSINYLEKGPASVKIDGINASIRLITLDNKKTFVMDRGSNKPLDVKGITKAELVDRFGGGHGMIKIGGTVLDIFNDSIPKIKPALIKLGLWENPNILFNIEYVAGATNVLEYDSNFLAVHGLLEIQQITPTRRATKEIPYSKSAMQNLLDNLVPVAKSKGYEVLGTVPTKLEGTPDLSGALNKSYTVNYGDREETKKLSQWLAKATVPQVTIKTKDGKNVSALSKEVLTKILNGTALSEFIVNPNDYLAAVNGFAIYLATMKLGDAILEKLSSPLGPVSKHEGIVIRDKKISKDPYKITGKFILGGLASSFNN